MKKKMTIRVIATAVSLMAGSVLVATLSPVGTAGAHSSADTPADASADTWAGAPMDRCAWARGSGSGDSNVLPRGFYDCQLAPWFARFPRSQLLALVFEDFVSSREATLEAVARVEREPRRHRLAHRVDVAGPRRAPERVRLFPCWQVAELELRRDPSRRLLLRLHVHHLFLRLQPNCSAFRAQGVPPSADLLPLESKQTLVGLQLQVHVPGANL